jgi:hypothetical protein
MSTSGSRSVTVHQSDAWQPFAVAGLGLLLLLGLIQVPDVDGALSLAIVCVPLGIVPAAFVGVQYRLVARSPRPEVSTRRRNAFTAVVGLSGAADAVALAGILWHFNRWSSTLFLVLVIAGAIVHVAISD